MRYTLFGLWVVALSLVTTSAFAETPREFCGADPRKELKTHYGSRMEFKNSGGLFDLGTCWWHSRLQRNSAYLAIYRPELPRASESEYTALVRDLIRGDRVVEIPGYTNLFDFSLDQKTMIQSLLNEWQLTDGFIWQRWIDGLNSSARTTPEELRLALDTIYARVEHENLVQFVKVKFRGIQFQTHALLIIGMSKIKNGYHLNVIDSNHPQLGDSQVSDYHYGDSLLNQTTTWRVNALKYTSSHDLIIFQDFDDELDRIQGARKEFCQTRK